MANTPRATHHDDVFVPQPRQRELGYWLSEDAARYAPAGVTTALRAMAWNRSQLRGLAGAALGAGVAFTGLGILGAVVAARAFCSGCPPLV